MSEFLPQGYEVPKSSGNYLRFKDGENIIRILGNAIVGWVDWTLDKKPVRTKEKLSPINPAKPVKHFWAFPVWDYSDEKVKILEITQATIQEAIYALHNDDDWGNPTEYDLNIKKTGKDLETKYSVMPKPKKPVSPEIVRTYTETPLDLNELLKGGDPFKTDGQSNATDINVDEIPL